MAKNKTKETTVDVYDFINEFADSDQKKKDSYELIELMQTMTGLPPKMWGPSIVGFGQYHYKYASGHEGDAPLLGFSPRKAAISLYVFTGLEEHLPLLEKLGKFKMGKACIYVKRMSDIDIEELKKVMTASIDFVKENHDVRC